MTKPNEPTRQYLSEDFLRLAIALSVVVVSMVALSWLERRSSIVSKLITLPAGSAVTSTTVVPSASPDSGQTK